MADSTLPSVAERLRMMRPSQEPGDFYRARMHQTDTEKGDIMRKLETPWVAFDEQVWFRGLIWVLSSIDGRLRTLDSDDFKWQVSQHDDEITQLQQALSDVQVFLFEARHHGFLFPSYETNSTWDSFVCCSPEIVR
jgi:coiled-coil domain-containing protein 77